MLLGPAPVLDAGGWKFCPSPPPCARLQPTGLARLADACLYGQAGQEAPGLPSAPGHLSEVCVLQPHAQVLRREASFQEILVEEDALLAGSGIYSVFCRR